MTEHYILLQKIIGLGSKKVKRIIEKYGDASAVFSARTDELKRSGLFTSAQIEKIRNADIGYAKRILNDCNALGIAAIPFGSVLYPSLLSEIPNPPLMLYAKGNLELLNTPCICIVGTRKVSPFGKKAAFSLAARLSAGGFTVVSGGATGSDTAAHLGALAVGGNTVCVYPSGINSSYLKANKDLRNKISEKGLLVSECPPNDELKKGMIPLRNRIMSGLSVAVTVVEAALKSGTMITAYMALEQNRDVFAVPGKTSDACFEGSNKLISEGAVPLTDARIVFSEYSARFPNMLDAEKAYKSRINAEFLNTSDVQSEKPAKETVKQEKKTENIQKNINFTLSKPAEMVYNNLNKQIFSLDEIKSDELSPSQFLAAVTELEIKGIIKAIPGGRYEIKN